MKIRTEAEQRKESLEIFDAVKAVHDQELELRERIKKLEAANYVLKEERDAIFDENEFLKSKVESYEAKVRDLEEQLIPDYYIPAPVYDCDDVASDEAFGDYELFLDRETEDLSINGFRQFVELKDRLFILSVEQPDESFKYFKCSSKKDAEKMIEAIHKERWAKVKLNYLEDEIKCQNSK